MGENIFHDEREERNGTKSTPSQVKNLDSEYTKIYFTNVTDIVNFPL